MKKVVYRILFRIQSQNDLVIDRNEKLEFTLSSIENIETEEKINLPEIGSILEVDGEDYQITDFKYSFEQTDEIVYYNQIVEIIRAKTKEEREKENRKNQEDILFKKMRELILNNDNGWGRNFNSSYKYYLD